MDAPQQPPERQGGVHVPRRGPGAPQGRLQRPPARGPAAGPAAGLDVARTAADVALPGDDLDRAGLAEQGTYRRRSLLGDDRRPRGQGRGAGAAQAGPRDAFLLTALRPVSASPPPGRSSTAPAGSATRSRPRPVRSTTARPTRPSSSTRQPTSGSAIQSRPGAGRGSGSTRASRPGRSGSGSSAMGAPAPDGSSAS